MLVHAQIVGWGRYVPPKVLTNTDLEKLVETSDEWIRTRTGIRERHIAAPEESTSTMAVKAAREALQVADVHPNELDLIVVATSTPDYFMPPTASIVQDALGASRAGAFDLNTACSGFVYALATGSRFITGGTAKNVLVIGADTMSRIMDYTDRGTCIIFGDGAGAVLLQATAERTGVLSYVLGSDGSGADLLWIPAGGSKTPASHETITGRQHYMRMKGNEVYRFAVSTLGKTARQAVAAAGLDLEDVDMLIPHQANVRIIQASAKALKLPPEKIYTNIEFQGNTSAASIPIALCEALEKGLVKPDDNLVFVAFGGGLTWGAMVVKWGVATPAGLPLGRRLLHRAWEYFPTARSLSHRVARKMMTWTLPSNGNGTH